MQRHCYRTSTDTATDTATGLLQTLLQDFYRHCYRTSTELQELLQAMPRTLAGVDTRVKA